MLPDAELNALRAAESDRSEWKESVSKESIKKTICAMANDLPGHGRPGVIFVGVNKRGEGAGLNITDETLQALANLALSGAIVPPPSVEVRRAVPEGSECAIFVVHPSQLTPIRLDGRVYVRTGPTTRAASAEDERRLTERRRGAHVSFDAVGVPGATLADLNFDYFRTTYLPLAVDREVLAQNQPTEQQRMASLRLLTPDGVPTVAGVPLLSSSPRQWLPGAYIQFLRVDGTALSDPIIDRKEIDGPLPEQVRLMDDVLRTNIRVRTTIAGQVETNVPDYPIEALRQLARNAVMHRTYDYSHAPVRLYWFADRVEIHSPGGPFGAVTIANFGNPGVADYRNPTVADAMRVLGYVQRFGAGIAIAR